MSIRKTDLVRFLLVIALTGALSAYAAEPTAEVTAGSFEDAAAAYEGGDYATALRILRPLADQGSAKAQYYLGSMYLEGWGVSKDSIEAVKWYRKAADQGDARAQFNLGVMYDEGRGVGKYQTEALKWYRSAAEQGFAPAQYNLGLFYVGGRGLPIIDYVQAYMWFQLAAERSPASDSEFRKSVSLSAAQIAAVMTIKQIVEAQRLAREWKPKQQSLGGMTEQSTN